MAVQSALDRGARVSLICMASILAYLARADGERGTLSACGASRPSSTLRARAHLNAKCAAQLNEEGRCANGRAFIERFIRAMPFAVSEEDEPTSEESLDCRRARSRLLREAAPRRRLREPPPRTGVAAIRRARIDRSALPSVRVASSHVSAKTMRAARLTA